MNSAGSSILITDSRVLIRANSLSYFRCNGSSITAAFAGVCATTHETSGREDTLEDIAMTNSWVVAR